MRHRDCSTDLLCRTAAATAAHPLREGRGVSDSSGVRDAACPLRTRGGGSGPVHLDELRDERACRRVKRRRRLRRLELGLQLIQLIPRLPLRLPGYEPRLSNMLQVTSLG